MKPVRAKSAAAMAAAARTAGAERAVPNQLPVAWAERSPAPTALRSSKSGGRLPWMRFFVFQAATFVVPLLPAPELQRDPLLGDGSVAALAAAVRGLLRTSRRAV